MTDPQRSTPADPTPTVSRAIRLRLIAALLAFAAGTAAVIVAILLVRSVL